MRMKMVLDQQLISNMSTRKEAEIIVFKFRNDEGFFYSIQTFSQCKKKQLFKICLILSPSPSSRTSQ